MKKLLILFSFTFILGLSLFSQEETLDYAHLKLQYHHTYLKDTLDVDTFDDLFILQIGNSVSKFYSYYTFQMDSLRKTPDGKKVWQELFARSLDDFNQHRDRKRWLGSFPRTRSSTFVYKNYPSGKMTVTDVISNDSFIYQDTLNAQDWQIIDSTKTILDYQCQKAVCDFRGREWTAWFSPEIPVSNGPWKLGGLPGLILEVYDADKHYYFSIVGIESVEQEPIIFSRGSTAKIKFRKINRRELLKAKMNQLRNSTSIMSAESGIPFGNDKPVYRDLIERDYK